MKERYSPLYFFLLMLLCFIVFVISYKRHKAHWLEQAMESHAAVIEKDTWALDPEGPVAYLTLASKRDNYSKMIIVGLAGETFLSIEGPKLGPLDRIMEQIGLIPQSIMKMDVRHDGEIIGVLIVHHRNMNIYVYFYAMVILTLSYITIILFLKTIRAKHLLEERVRERTTELEEEIEERKQVENELTKAQSLIENIIDSMPSILVGVDPNGKITQWNKTAEQTTGLAASVAQGQLLTTVLPRMASEMAKITESIRTRKTIQKQKKSHPSKNGIYYEDLTIYPLISNGVEGAVIRVDDVTEQVRLEEMMVQSEKMLSVGGLAAGMAHEINNPLAGMMQTANVMKDRLTNIEIPANKIAAEEIGIDISSIKAFMEKRGIPRMIATITESGHRVATIVDNMLSFARKSNAQYSSHSLNELIDRTLELAGTDYDLKKHYDFKQIEIQRIYEDNLPLASCEGAKMQQVLLNILRNGAQAMQGAGTQNPMFLIRTGLEKNKNMLCIEIEDNGPGMDEEIRKRIFEPFFTTKPVGVGTGLGLSVSYFIITENHNGEMLVESNPGSGAKFIIHLPLENKKI